MKEEQDVLFGEMPQLVGHPTDLVVELGIGEAAAAGAEACFVWDGVGSRLQVVQYHV